MYQPGDYVVGYPDYYESDGKRFIKSSFYGKPGDIKCHENKEAMLTGLFTADYFKQIYNGKRDWGDKSDLKFTFIHYTEFRGLVIAVDNLNEKRPHWDGLVQILIDEKLYWVFARNLRLVRYAGTKS